MTDLSPVPVGREDGATDVPEPRQPSDADILAGTTHGDFVLTFELSEAERLRLCDAGAAHIADAYARRLRESAEALSRIVQQRAQPVARMRETLIGAYLRELEHPTDDHPVQDRHVVQDGHVDHHDQDQGAGDTHDP
jgi:hypothetical protein